MTVITSFYTNNDEDMNDGGLLITIKISRDEMATVNFEADETALLQKANAGVLDPIMMIKVLLMIVIKIEERKAK